MKNLCLLLIFTLLTGRIFAGITITFNAPGTNFISDNPLSIQVLVQSVNAVSSVTAVAGGRTTVLTAVANNAYYNYEGTLNITGLPQDTTRLTVYATDAFNNCDSASVNFIYSIPPDITVVQPAPYSVARPLLPVEVIYHGHDTSKSYSVSLSYTQPWNAPGSDPDRYPVFMATTKDSVVKGMADLSYHNGGNTYAPISVFAPGKQSAGWEIPLFVEASPYLQPFYTAVGAIQDQQHGKILGLNMLPTLTDSATRITHYFPDSSVLYDFYVQNLSGYATYYGAIIHAPPQGNHPDRLIDWRFEGNKYTVLDSNIANIGRPFVAGKYVVWVKDNNLYLKNLDSANTVQITNTVSGGSLLTVTENGTVFYCDRVDNNDVLKRYYNQHSTTLYTGTNGHPLLQAFAVGDSGVVFCKYDQSIGFDSMLLYNKGRITILGRYKLTSVAGHGMYYSSNQYLAYPRADSSGHNAIWLRRPDGSIQRKTFYAGEVWLTGITSKGDILYNYAPPNFGTHAYFVAANANSAYAQVLTAAPYPPNKIFSDTGFIIAIGNTLFRVNGKHITDTIRPISKIMDAQVRNYFSAADFVKGYSGKGELAAITITRLPKYGKLTLVDVAGNSHDVGANERIVRRFINGMSYLCYNPNYLGKDTLYWTAFNGVETVKDSAICELKFEPGAIVRIDSFTVQLSGSKQTHLHWVTGTEKKINYFDIFRSKGLGPRNYNFVRIGQLKGQGALDRPTAYDFTDPAPDTGYNYYMLGIGGNSGHFHVFSDTISIRIYPPSVQLKNFTLHQQGDENILQWQTGKENSITSFELQRSDGTNAAFQTIYTATAKGGPDLPASYQYADGDPVTGKNYYRVKANGADNFVAYSDTLNVDIPVTFARFWALVWPNPVFSGPLNLSLLTARQRILQVNIVAADGKIVSTEKFTLIKGSLQKQLTVSSLPNGLYFIVITDGHMKRALPFIKLK